MTICTAAIFRWVYDAESMDVGPAIITASDRMLTDEGLSIQADRLYTKVGRLGDKCAVLVADSIPIHSAILKGYLAELKDKPETSVPKLAEGYAKRMRDYRADRAAESVLSVFKLDNESFLARQRELKDSFVMQAANDMADYKIKAQALVVGCDEQQAHLYHVDSMGMVTCHDDIGFVSAGIGGVHSSAHFMLGEYTPTWPYYWALYMTYMAKKRAEAAPGCGPTTDMLVINRLGAWPVDLRTIAELDKMFGEEKAASKVMIEKSAERLMEFDKTMHGQPTEPPSEGKAHPANGAATSKASASVEPASEDPSPKPS